MNTTETRNYLTQLLVVLTSEGVCRNGHAWADGFVVNCESCARVAELVNQGAQE